MANSYIIDLGSNDSLQEVVRKANANFKTLYTRSKQNQSSIKSSSSMVDSSVSNGVGEVNSAVTNGVNRINTAVSEAVDNGVASINRRLSEAEQNYASNLHTIYDNLVTELAQKAKEITVPPVGTIIICEYNPNEEWPSSIWEQIYIENIELNTWKRVS